MKVIKKVREINDKYGEVTAHLNAVGKKMEDNGLKVQDKPLLEKLIKNTPNPIEIFETIQNMKALVYKV